MLRAKLVKRVARAATAFMACLFIVSPTRAQPRDDAHSEFGAFPVVGGSTDLGFGGGAFASFARFEPGYRPYRYRISSAAVLLVRPSNQGRDIAYQDLYVDVTLPQLLQRRLRLQLRPSYTRESNLRYYGIGSASEPPPDARRFALDHLAMVVRARLRLTQRVQLELGDVFKYIMPHIPVDSALARDASRPELQPYFRSVRPHAINLFETTLLYDTRDQETSARSGQFHELRLRLSPGGISPLPYRYAQLNLTLRAYRAFGRFTWAGRLVVDSLLGSPPFYELARYEETYAFGGVNGIRGVPAQRYYGRHKVFSNLELRADVVGFDLFGLPCQLQTVGFFDAGRLWAQWPADPELDVSGLGLVWGAGVGLRLQQGQAFVVRADIAWSPDAKPIGAYVTSGQLF